jgi:hypothetical protein
VRPLELHEKKALYTFTKAMLIVLGSALLVYGTWFFISRFLGSPHNPEFWFGIFPAYLGCMMILVSIAMKIEWFTDARRFW